MESLLDKVSLDEAEVDRSKIKIGILAGLGVISFFLFGFFLKLFILENASNSFIFLSAAAVVFLIIFLLQILFIKTLWRVNFIIFLEVIGLTAGFYDKISFTLLITSLIVFLVLMWASYNGRREFHNMLKMRFFRISKIVFPKAIMGLALFASVIYYSLSGLGAYAEDPELVEGFFIPQSTFEKIISPAANIINKLNILPEFDFSASIGDLVKNMAQEQINESPQLQMLPEAVKEQMIVKAIKKIEIQISDFLGMPIKSEAKISATLYNVMVDKFSGLPKNIKSAILIGIAVIIFLTIEGIAWPIRWVIAVFAWLIYELLLAAGFANIVLEGKSRELIILK
ncbi:MAG TPA: hypothetical protein ENH26_00470 [Candidatus Wolfebacteria bacterium]|nr:hypothetical protein [Candidatus Wolfebacteria bacterium]